MGHSVLLWDREVQGGDGEGWWDGVEDMGGAGLEGPIGEFLQFRE